MALVFPSDDTIFPRSAASALSSAITIFVSLWLANNYLRNSMNKIVLSDWKHTLKKCNPPGQAHVQSHAQSTPWPHTGNLLCTFTKYCANQNLSKTSAVRQAVAWCHGVQKKDKWQKEKSGTTLNTNSGYASSARREWQSVLILRTSPLTLTTVVVTSVL